MSRVPLVGVSACRQQLGKYDSHTVGDKYVEAAAFAGLPLVLPARRTPSDPELLLANLDGILFTGSPSNIEPYHYDGASSADGTHHDPDRDANTLPLLRLAIDRGVPVFCICRGFQELNVTLGGSLHQRVHELPDSLDHREPQHEWLAEQYEPQHEVEVLPGGVFEQIGLARQFRVNSLHSQGINRLAGPLRTEAVAPDGLIEAVSVRDAPGFAIGVQWHPEWRFIENPESLMLFQAFRLACREHAAKR